ncbi:hypothetical protein [Haloarchaeobius iranensis]|uniref:Uncharacterized protein n=1 Tax=Haloarchaeobius iranensis TaxID=996166 RepID=A0A1H0AXL5_9EURY|nr:hypothetical protein [Haloarchaeobius iranensis]SDN38182.1 hypothetical protein SAMN05192554_13114 [Haloarchaeobius iranensis]
MPSRSRHLGAAVFLANLAIPVAVVVFAWSPLSAVALLLTDIVLCIGRMATEQLFAGRPRDDTDRPRYRPVQLSPFWQKEIYGSLLRKRGAIRFGGRLPPVYPRNLPFVLETAGGALVVVGLLFAGVWSVVPPVTGALDAALLVVLPAVALRHVAVVATWSATGRYERAAATTVRRRREFLYAGLVACLAVLFVGASERAAIGVVLALVPKVAFDLRDAGIGPAPGTTADTAEDSLELPVTSPRETFEQRASAVYGSAAGIAVFHLLFPGLPVVYLVVLLGIAAESVLLSVVLLTATFIAVFVLDLVAVWLAHANVEYRLYDDRLVAYDRLLDEPQWSLPFDDVTDVTAHPQRPEDQLLVDSPHRLNHVHGWLPFVGIPVRIERRDGDALGLAYLDRPEAFVRAVEARRATTGQSRGRPDVSSVADT